MFGIGETELVLILLFAFMIFGPDKLPGMGRTLGRALRQFRNAQEGFTQVVQTQVVDPATEAMGDNAKKPTRNRAAEYEEDADLDDADAADKPRAKRTETFAERKARLAAEKAAAAEAARAAASAEKTDADEDADAEPEAAAEPAPAAEPEAPAAEPAPAPKPRTAADLYALTPKRAKAEAAAEPEPAAEPAPAADAASTAPTTGEEAGSTQA